MDPQTESRRAVTSAGIDSSAEERYFGEAPLEEIHRELKHYGVPVEDIMASLRAYLTRRIAESTLQPLSSQISGAEKQHPEELPFDPERMFLESLPSIERIAKFAARRGHLTDDETEEFSSEVRLRLVEGDYAILRKFEGRSSLTVYLTTVIIRLFHKYRVARLGHWRPSAEARRIGDKAISLERLLTRDGYSFAQAVFILTTGDHGPVSMSELEAIYARLPLRLPRPLLVSEDLDSVPATNCADDSVQELDRARIVRRVTAALDTALGEMDAEDRLILQLRFWHGRKVPDIALMLKIDQKKLYKRLDRLFSTLRQSLKHAGIDRSTAADLVGHPASDLSFESMPERMQTTSDAKRLA